MVNGDISNFSLPPQQIGTLSVNVHDWKGFVIFERIQSPSSLGDASLGGLIVFDHYPSECVGIFGERTRQLKIGLLLLSRGIVCVIAPCPRLSKIILLTFFTTLSVFPAPLIVVLTLSLLRGKCVSLSVSISTSISLPWSVRFPPAPPLLWLVASSPPLITTSPMLIPFLFGKKAMFKPGSNRTVKTRGCSTEYCLF